MHIKINKSITKIAFIFKPLLLLKDTKIYLCAFYITFA